ncbi:MAG: urate hydroxylase PuuD, partial [Halomonas sp.]|nr:urate hydroxylase PuuD [Halomonas sp.]MDX5502778.1 urate hydroxylase PuuD [Halomonas sp.]
ISNHYSFVYNHEYAWVLMSLFIFAGALIRQFFVLMHMGKIQPAYPAAGTALILVVFWLAMPGGQATTGGATLTEAEGPSFEEVHALIDQHCVACHSRQPTQPGFSAPPAGIAYDSADQIRGQKERIQQVVGSKYMPLGNMTGMTDEEREVIAAWSE